MRPTPAPRIERRRCLMGVGQINFGQSRIYPDHVERAVPQRLLKG